MERLHGCIPILCTPFDEHGELVLEDMSRQIEWVLAEGASGVATLAIASEGYKLTEAERELVTRIVVESVAGRVPVVVSADGTGTAIAVDRAVRAEAAGADVVMCLPPYFVKPSPHGLLDYYASIATAVSIPVMIQDAPQLTGVPMGPEMWAELHDRHGNIAYVKAEGTPQGGTISDTLQLSHNQIGLFCGWGGVGIIDALDRGAIGVMPAPNFTRVFAETQQLYESGQRSEAMNLLHRWLPYIVWTMQSIDFSVRAAKETFVRLGVFRTSVQRQPAAELDMVSLNQLSEWIETGIG